MKGGNGMPNKPRKVSHTGYYHVMARGINKEKTFNQPREKNRLKSILEEKVKHYAVEVHAYCIMSNHVHLIIKAEVEELSMFMARVLADYAEYYNYKHDRNGHVFQNRFKSECIESESYYWACLRYIHLNPVKAQISTEILKYNYSSIQDFCAETSSIIHENAFNLKNQKFESTAVFLRYHQDICNRVFLDVSSEVYYQFYEISMQILNQMQIQNQLVKAIEVLEKKELRKKLKEEMKNVLGISEKKTDVLIREIRNNIR